MNPKQEQQPKMETANDSELSAEADLYLDALYGTNSTESPLLHKAYADAYRTAELRQKEHSYSEQEQWVSVKDVLPEHERKVRAIITYGSGRMEEIHTNYVKRIECFDSFFTDQITHWQEITLPAPPKQ